MDRRSLYIETALGLFIGNGYNGVSMDSIVEATGGSKATLYRHFDSKEDLFGAIIDDLMAKLAPPEMPAGLVDLPLEEGLHVLGTATATAALSERAIVLLRLASGEFGRFPQLARQLFERAPALSYARFRGYLKAKRDQGDLDIDDLQIGAEQFLAGIVGHQQLRMQLGVGTPSRDDIERRVDSAVTMFVRAYRRPMASSD